MRRPPFCNKLVFGELVVVAFVADRQSKSVAATPFNPVRLSNRERRKLQFFCSSPAIRCTASITLSRLPPQSFSICCSV